MISVSDAQNACLALVEPCPTEPVSLINAAGRVLAQPARTRRAQPPFAASAMDGYAVRNVDTQTGATLTVIGESAAGHGWHGTVNAGQAVRIFTGAPVPNGADRIVIQEDVTRSGDKITLNAKLDEKHYIRPQGADFTSDFALLAPRQLSASDVALLAAMNVPTVQVTRRPVVAIIATGDELVMPGETPGPDQIIASNTFALHAMLTAAGAEARILPIARDTLASVGQAFDLAQNADLIVTIGGASVGDHDLVGQAAEQWGLDRAFYKIAMRPGKPLMAGKLGKAAFVGLPGNPVSSIVCGHVFLRPMIRKMRGLTDSISAEVTVTLANALGSNGPRAHYMRAKHVDGTVTVHDRQDSALLSVLTDSNCLVIRPPHDGPRLPGDKLTAILF